MDTYFEDARLEKLFFATWRRLPAGDRRKIASRLAYVTDRRELLPYAISEDLPANTLAVTYPAYGNQNAIVLFADKLVDAKDRLVRFVAAHELAHVCMKHVTTEGESIDGRTPSTVEHDEQHANMLAVLWGFPPPTAKRAAATARLACQSSEQGVFVHPQHTT